MVQLPGDEWGTTGLVYFPRDQRNFRHWSVRWIKLGFDSDFSPVVRVGCEKQNTNDISWATKNPPEPGATEYNDVWNNRWIYKEPRRMIKIEKFRDSESGPYKHAEREYTASEYVDHRGFEHHKADSTDGIEFYQHYLGLKIRIRLKDCPNQVLPRHLSVPGSGPWKVWTLDIQERRDFTKEVQNQRSRYVAGGGILLGALPCSHIMNQNKAQPRDEALAQDDAKSCPTRPNKTPTPSAALRERRYAQIDERCISQRTASAP